MRLFTKNLFFFLNLWIILVISLKISRLFNLSFCHITVATYKPSWKFESHFHQISITWTFILRNSLSLLIIQIKNMPNLNENEEKGMYIEHSYTFTLLFLTISTTCMFWFWMKNERSSELKWTIVRLITILNV